jgi:phage gp16-like protein
MSKLARDHRNTDLAKIHLAKKQLDMDDGVYREIIRAVGRAQTGSSKDLDHAGRKRVLEHMAACGFKPQNNTVTNTVATTSAKPLPAAKTARPGRPTPAADALPLVRRIRAQCISLDRLDDTYIDGMARQMLGTEAPQFFEWCQVRDLYKISQALGVFQARKGALTS